MPKRLMLIAAFALLAGCKDPVTPNDRLTEPLPPLPVVPKEVKTPIDPALQAKASQQLAAAANSMDEVVRAHALESYKTVKTPDAAKQILGALNDSSPLVRKSAAFAAGEMRIADAADRISARMETADPQERVADIFALHRLGDTRYSHKLEKYAVDPNPHLRGDTAMALGMIGDKSAIPLLQQMMVHDSDITVGLQAAEALWRMGDETAMETLISATISRYVDDRIIGITALAGPRDTRVLAHIEGQLHNRDYPEITLAAARAAGMLGSDRGLGIALNGAKSVDPRQRLLAAMALGEIGRSDSQPVLEKLLTDGNEDVRVAAAESLLQIGTRK